MRILDGQIPMVQQHVDRRGDRRRFELVHGREHADRLHEDYMGNPRTAGNECLRGSYLPRVVAGNQTNKDVRVNGAHGAASHRPSGQL